MWQAIRGRIGLHNPPKDKAFTCLGAVFVGGPCSREGCDDPVARERAFIGNAWDFPGGKKMAEEIGGFEVLNLSYYPPDLTADLKRRGLTYIGDFPA